MINYSIISELLFPVRCAGCGSYEGRPLCPSCNTNLPLIKGPACRRCGKPALYEVDGCLECRGRIRHLDATMAMALYEEPLRSAIHKLKYGNGWRLAAPLGAMAAVRLAPLLGSERPLVTFVPMHARKRWARGYDHAEKLAQGVARALGLDAVRLVERTRFTPSQSSLNHEGRRVNVRGAFGPAGRQDERVKGSEVIIVDDVLTTGYTLTECARVLRECGAGRITACVLARDVVRDDRLRP
jgi:ComF family protein